jgi:hypothetical protein
MDNLTDYNNNVSEYELFDFFYKQIIAGDICTFSSLKKLAEPVLANKQTHPVILQAFGLIKNLYWGFFSAITPLSYGKLWKEIVITDEDFPDAGDLKRTLQISNIYIAMLDIHGYTNFCMESRKNLSMMHRLDHAMETEVGRISASCGALSHREQGDGIIVVAASATDALTATLSIIDYFSKTDVVQDPNIITGRTNDTTALPAFKISAGITGGNTTSPLTITEKGDLNGFLLNSGARLQTRADELSPNESKIMIARQVQMNFVKENAQSPCFLAKNNAVYFFDTGHIEFKGVTIPTCEVIFRSDERYKVKFSTEMSNLIDATRENLWEHRIFTDLMQLIIRAAQAMPQFEVVPSSPIEGIQKLTNESLIHLGKKAMIAYVKDEDYPYAVNLLHVFVDIMEMIPNLDRLILDYLKGVYAKYAILINSFNKNIDQQVDANASVIFPINIYKTWVATKKANSVYEKLRETGKKSQHIERKKNLWYKLIKQNDLTFTLHSGKH